jgi:hypothetical protein
MSIITATFVAMFDYSYCDPAGNIITETPMADRTKHSACKPSIPMRLKYKLREHVA